MPPSPRKSVALGSPDLDLDALLDGLTRALAACGYSLEWVPGAVTGNFHGALLYVRWVAPPDPSAPGAWAVLPDEPHGGRVAAELLRALGRPLVRVVAQWYPGGRGGSVSLTAFDAAPDGTRRPRPTGFESRDLDALTEGSPSDRLMQLLRLAAGVPDAPATRQRTFPIYEVGAPPADPPPPGPPSAAVFEKRLNETLDLLRRPGSRGELRRDSPDTYLAEIHGAEPHPISVYLDPPTAAALTTHARAEGLNLRDRATVGGPDRGWE